MVNWTDFDFWIFIQLFLFKILILDCLFPLYCMYWLQFSESRSSLSRLMYNPEKVETKRMVFCSNETSLIIENILLFVRLVRRNHDLLLKWWQVKNYCCQKNKRKHSQKPCINWLAFRLFSFWYFLNEEMVFIY